jgi:tetratricopeptide (TPR) repeat protein
MAGGFVSVSARRSPTWFGNHAAAIATSSKHGTCLAGVSTFIHPLAPGRNAIVRRERTFFAIARSSISASSPRRPVRASEMLQKQAQPELALTCAKNAIKLDPKIASAHYSKSSVLSAHKRNDQSIAAFVRLHALKSRYVDASFISRLRLTEKEVAALQQVRAAALAAHPNLRQNRSHRPIAIRPPLQ